MTEISPRFLIRQCRLGSVKKKTIFFLALKSEINDQNLDRCVCQVEHTNIQAQVGNFHEFFFNLQEFFTQILTTN